MHVAFNNVQINRSNEIINIKLKEKKKTSMKKVLQEHFVTRLMTCNYKVNNNKTSSNHD